MAPEPSGEIATATINTVLSDSGLRGEVVRIFSQPQVENRIPSFLNDPVLREVTVRLLAHPEMAGVAQTVFLARDGAPSIARLLSQANTQAPMTHILAESGMERAVNQTLELTGGAAREALFGLLRSAEGRAVIARALPTSSPDVRARIFQMLEEAAGEPHPSQPPRAASLQPAAELLARADVQARASEFLSDQRTAVAFLRVLSQAGTGTAVRLLARGDVQAQMARLLSQPATQTATLALLASAQAENAPAVEAILTREDVRALLPQLLANSESQATFLRTLARPELTELARQVLSQPESVAALTRTFVEAARLPQSPIPGEAIADYPQSAIPNPQSPIPNLSVALDLLSRADMAEAARQVFASSPDTVRALVQLLSESLLSVSQSASLPVSQFANRTDQTDRTVLNLPFLQSAIRNPQSTILSPQSSALSTFFDVANALRMLAQTGMTDAARQVLGQVLAAPDALRGISQWIGRAETRTALLEILTRPEMAEIGARVFEQPGMADTLANLIRTIRNPIPVVRLLSSSPRQAAMILEALARPENAEAAARYLAREDVQNQAVRLLRQPETRQALLSLLARPELAGPARALLERPDVQTALTEALRTPDSRLAVLRLVEQPALRDLSQAILSKPETAELLRQVVMGRAPGVGGRAERAAALALLARTDLPQVVRQALLSPEGLNTLVDSIRLQPGSAGTAAAAEEAALLQLLARPEMASAAQAVLHRPEISAQIPRLLMQPETRGAALELLARPGMEDVVRVVFGGNAGRLLAVELTRAPALRNLMAQFLTQPEISRAIIAGLSLPQNWETAVRFFALEEAQRQAATLLASAAPRGAPEEAAVRALQRDLLALLARPDMAAVAARVLSQPGSEALFARLLSDPETRMNALALLTRPQLAEIARQILSEPSVSAALSDIAALKPPAAQPDRPGQAAADTPRQDTQPLSAPTAPRELPEALRTAQAMLLEILSRPEMAALAREVFARADVQAQAARLLEEPRTRALLLRLLSQPELSGAASLLTARPDVQRQLAQVLMTSGAQAALDAEIRSIRPEVLQFLARPENLQAARDVLLRPAMPAQALEMLSDPETRPGLLALLTRPEMAGVAADILTAPQARDVLARIVSGPAGPAAATQMLSNPATAVILLEALSDPALSAVAQTLLSRVGAQAQLSQLLSDPAARKVVLGILALPEMRNTAQSILQRPDAAARIAEWVQSPETRVSMLTILAQSGPRVRAELSSLLRAVFEDPGTIASLRQLFQPGAASSFESLRSGRSAAVRILAWTEMADVARQVFQSSESRQVLAQMLVETAEALQAWQRDVLSAGRQRPAAPPPPGVDAVLQLLARPGMAATAQQVLATPQTRAALADLLAPPAAPVRGTGGEQVSALLADAEAILRILSRPELTDAAREVFARMDVQARVAQFLFQGETRAAMLQILSSPDMAEIAAQILDRRDVRIALIQAAFSPSAESRVALLLSNPAVATVLLDALSDPANQAAAFRLLARPDVQLQLLRLAETPQLRQTIAAALRQADVPQVAATLLSLAERSARTSPQAREFFDAVRLALETRSVEASGARSPLGAAAMDQPDQTLGSAALRNILTADSRATGRLWQIFGPDGKYPISPENLERLERALERLADTSPARARQALRTLPILAELGAKNLETILGGIAQRLDKMSAQLAQKGGLPPGLREPVLTGSSLLMMAFEDLSGDRLTALVRTLVQRGVEITFAGRNLSGAAQIHIQVAEMPLGSAERREAPLPSGAVIFGGLTRGETAALANLLPDRQVADLLAGLRPEAAAQYAFNPLITALFGWLRFGPAPGATAGNGGFVAEGGELIPSMLDLVRMEPLLLTYEPGELVIPGTDIPLILPPGWQDA